MSHSCPPGALSPGTAGSGFRALLEPTFHSQVPTWRNLVSSSVERCVSWSRGTVPGCCPRATPLWAGALLPIEWMLDQCWGSNAALCPFSPQARYTWGYMSKPSPVGGYWVSTLSPQKTLLCREGAGKAVGSAEENCAPIKGKRSFLGLTSMPNPRKRELSTWDTVQCLVCACKLCYAAGRWRLSRCAGSQPGYPMGQWHSIYLPMA